MTRRRVTVARLMAIVLFLGFGFAALRYSADKNAEIDNLSARIKQMEVDASQKQETLTTIIREMRDRLDRPANTLELPDGHVIVVDYERHEVKIDITGGQGARARMKLTIFDSASPGVPSEKPKGTIELTQVGEQCSTARIIKTNNSIGPIRAGDVVYSPVWSPNTPVRLAILGKVDINRDGKDDRELLMCMIREAGGVIDFDLPPSDVGKQTGTLSPRIDWYVIDMVYRTRDPATEIPRQEVQFAKRMGEAIKEARLNGIRPMPIERLLDFLDYDMSQPAAAGCETADKGGIRPATSLRQPKVSP